MTLDPSSALKITYAYFRPANDSTVYHKPFELEPSTVGSLGTWRVKVGRRYVQLEQLGCDVECVPVYHHDELHRVFRSIHVYSDIAPTPSHSPLLASASKRDLLHHATYLYRNYPKTVEAMLVTPIEEKSKVE